MGYFYPGDQQRSLGFLLFLAHAPEGFLCQGLLLVDELTGGLRALGPGLLAHQLCLQLGALFDGALSGVVAGGF